MFTNHFLPKIRRILPPGLGVPFHDAERPEVLQTFLGLRDQLEQHGVRRGTLQFGIAFARPIHVTAVSESE